MSVLIAHQLGKSYQQFTSELSRFARWFGFPFKPSHEICVLRDVSFNLEAGEALGIIGRNGAGKSTLLKMLTGVLKPTSGNIQVHGKIAAILELGMGFNPDLSARANVFHALGLMGYTHAQISAVIVDVEAFAEIGEYFDTPMRTYSSGMFMRVAFATVTAFRPDILIVDEALSVGDAYFQHKSFAKIREFKELGTSLLIVSHDASAIQNICDRAILLDEGRMIKTGAPTEVFDFYNALIAEKENSTLALLKTADNKVQTRSGTGEAKILTIALYNEHDDPIKYVSVGELIKLVVRVEICAPIPSLVMGYCIKDRLGQIIWGTNTWHTAQVIKQPLRDTQFKFITYITANLGPGTYSFSIALHDEETHLTANYEWRDLALIFNVINTDKIEFSGCNWLDAKTQIEALSV